MPSLLSPWARGHLDPDGVFSDDDLADGAWATQRGGGVPVSEVEVIKHMGPGPHPSGTPQSVHGRAAHGTSAPQIAARTPGSTIDIVTGHRPTRGFVVAISAYGQQLPTSQPPPTKVRTYMNKHFTELTEPGHFLGTWVDYNTNTSWLDVVQVFDSSDYLSAFDQAAAFGSGKEIAMYDLLNDQTVNFDPPSLSDYRARLSSA